MRQYLIAAALLSVGLGAGTAMALPVNGTGNVTPDIIFGSGNDNGGFTGETVNGIEVGLRGKLRFDGSGQAQNVFNYDGDHTYTFDPTQSANPANRSLFNYEFSVNTNTTGTTGLNINDVFILLSFDNDRTSGVNFVSFDAVNGFSDNTYGTNATGNGGGTASLPGAIGDTNNVMQQSHNMGFSYFDGVSLVNYLTDPDAPGIYSFKLEVFDSADEQTRQLLASSAIDVIVETPEPGALALFGVGLLGFGLLRRRRKA